MVENSFDESYQGLLKIVLGKGEIQVEKRTGQLTLGVTGEKADFYLDERFPLLTTKPVSARWVGEELLWKLRGSRNAQELYVRGGVDIWNRNAFQHYLRRTKSNLADKKNTLQWEEEFVMYQEKMKCENFDPADSDLGPVYGFQLRHWTRPDGEKVDQLKKMLENLRRNPGGRYGFMTSLNSGEIQDMAIAPCPFHHQFSIYGDNLDSVCVQRSCDIFLGVPFNIAQEAMLSLLVSQELGLKSRKLSHHYLNLHTYLGVSPRSDFLADEKNLKEFQRRFNSVQDEEEYLELRDWYLNSAPEESKGNERKDHVPFMLMQLSKEPTSVPRVDLKEGSLFDLIEFSAKEVFSVTNYTPQKWDSKAVMAA